jgi:hypothetical protein
MAGLLGMFDPEVAQGFSVDPEERKRLLIANALLGVSGGLLGARKGQELQGLGYGMLQGAGMGQQAVSAAAQDKYNQFRMMSEGQKMVDQRKASQARADLSQKIGGLFAGADAPQGGPEQSAAPARPAKWQIYEQAAQESAAGGDLEQAKYYAGLAEKFRPKYSATPQVVRGVDGKVQLAQFSETEAPRMVDGMSPAEKLHFGSTGGMTNVGFDVYSGTPVSAGLPATVSPDAQLSSDTTRRGQNMVDARSREGNAIAANNTASGKVGELRKEFNSLPQVKNYATIQPILQSVREAASMDTAAADMNLVYGVAKIFDPDSVVRDSETTMTVKAGSPAQRFLGQFNYVAGGGRLTPKARAELIAQVESRAKGHEQGYAHARKAYEGIAAKNNIPADQVFIEPFATSQQQAPQAPSPQAASLTSAEQKRLEELRNKHGRRSS